VNAGHRRLAIVLTLLVGCALAWRVLVNVGVGDKRTLSVKDRAFAADMRGTTGIAVTEEQLRLAADALLADVNPELRSNGYFPGYGKTKLRWLMREHQMGRVDVRFFRDTATHSLPPDVVMASMRRGDKATIFLSRPRLASDLLATGGIVPPFNARQRNDFAISLIHEVLHLQNAAANPEDPVSHAREELRVWQEVTMRMVRPLRLLHQPVHPLFLQVDDLLRGCHDRLPCSPLEHLVRLEM
jgi:hypothetical protein